MQSSVDGLQLALRLHCTACFWKSLFCVCGGTGGRIKLRPLIELVSESPSKLKLMKYGSSFRYASGSSSCTSSYN